MKKTLLIVFLASLVACQSADELKKEQYFAEGFQLYNANCANCHQTDGSGMANLYPPLSGNPTWQKEMRLACIIKNGMRDTIVVNGRKFSRPMPANPKLTDLEIAEIATYMKVKWAGDSTYMRIGQVKEELGQCLPQGSANL